MTLRGQAGVLLDTVTFYRVLNGDAIKRAAYATMMAAQAKGRLFVSVVMPIEVALASQKKGATRMELSGLDAKAWCSAGARNLQARWVGIGQRVALSAAEASRRLEHRDPCDALIVATAHVRRLCLITADERMIALGDRNPDYLGALAC